MTASDNKEIKGVSLGLKTSRACLLLPFQKNVKAHIWESFLMTQDYLSRLLNLSIFVADNVYLNETLIGVNNLSMNIFGS